MLSSTAQFKPSESPLQLQPFSSANCLEITDGVSRPIFGITEGVAGLLVDIAYIPVFFVMIEKENFKMSCYKIMTVLAVVDFFSIIVDCIITGWLTYEGAVFCTHPEVIHFSGMTGEALWCTSCVLAVMLIINRLLDLTSPRARIFFFEGNRTYLFILVAIIYGLYFFFCNTPTAFTSKFHTWFFDPMIFEGKAMEYENFPILINNFSVVFLTCSLYVLFCIALRSKLKNTTGSESKKAVSWGYCSRLQSVLKIILVNRVETGRLKTKKELKSIPKCRSSMSSMQVFFQSVMICAVNLNVSVIYVIMNYIEVPPWLIIIGQLSWQLGNAAPVFIYLKFNKTIRNGVLKKLGMRVSFVESKSRAKNVSVFRKSTVTK
ncbi:hypothetical protein CRE_24786 [Caenorhabditis remanei]|uniref:G-protein coupled receptors family 1 profile domain-containing protein n=1 Tax=Caenorhabditis remanei TaxID=31234 RepID=E3NCT0_CAERE|nr:hypothetical protein CRE_24786 [Caenorhabditis remanei]